MADHLDHAVEASPAMRGHIAMLSFSALIAGSFSLGALAANDIAPAALNSVRFLIAAITIGCIAAATKSLDRRVAKAPWRFAILGGLFAIYFVLMFEGLKTASPVSSAAVFTLTPLISAGFGWLLLRQVIPSGIWLLKLCQVENISLIWLIPPSILYRLSIQSGIVN